MKSLADISETLNTERLRQKRKYSELADSTGLSVLAVRQALQGKVAIRTTSLLAIADQLGLEMVLLPKIVAQSMPSAVSQVEPVRTDIGKILDQHQRFLAKASQ